MVLTQRLADHLVKTNQLGYERHSLANHQRQAGEFSPSKVPFNLAAGSVAVFAKIPQKKARKQIKEVTGFSMDEYRNSIRRFKGKWAEAYPERVRKVPGTIAIQEVAVSSHALQSGEESPEEAIRSAARSEDETRRLINRLATSAYGRTSSRKEIDQLMQIYTATLEETGSHDESIRDAIVALLVSPPFLLRYYQSGDLSQYDFARTHGEVPLAFRPGHHAAFSGEARKIE